LTDCCRSSVEWEGAALLSAGLSEATLELRKGLLCNNLQRVQEDLGHLEKESHNFFTGFLITFLEDRDSKGIFEVFGTCSLSHTLRMRLNSHHADSV